MSDRRIYIVHVATSLAVYASHHGEAERIARENVREEITVFPDVVSFAPTTIAEVPLRLRGTRPWRAPDGVVVSEEHMRRVGE